MESNMVKKWALMAWLVLSSLSMANSTPFQDCYGSCFVVCTVTPGVAFLDYPMRCLKSCLTPASSISNAHVQQQNQFFAPSTPTVNASVHGQQNHFFCELGCAASSCTKFSTKQNPAAKEVGSCVDSCSQTCSKG